MLFRPFWVRGKGRSIMKVIYRDSDGYLRQLWGSSGIFGDDLQREYDDGQY